MTAEEALLVLSKLIGPDGLSSIQTLVFCQCWDGRTYQEIADSSSYDAGYVKDVGSKLWKFLSDTLGEKITKSNVQSVLRRYEQKVSQGTAHPDAIAPNPENLALEPISVLSVEPSRAPICDWGEAIDVSTFYGRDEELALLRQWVLGESNTPGCRLIALLGIGGIGKTALSIKLAHQVLTPNQEPHSVPPSSTLVPFHRVIWRSLRQAPSLQTLLADLIGMLSNGAETESELLNEDGARISRLLHYVRESRCLLVLDAIESLLLSGELSGAYRPEYDGYGELFRRLAEVPHQSCVVLTSREKPREIVRLEGSASLVRSLQLKGLSIADGRAIVEAKGSFYGSDADWTALVERYGGNPLILKMVAPSIQDLFGGHVAQFLELLQREAFVLEDLRYLLEAHLERLSPLEREALDWLAISRQGVAPSVLQDDLVSVLSRKKLPETLQSLVRRGLVERTTTGNSRRSEAVFGLQPLVQDYLTECLVERTVRGLVAGRIEELMSHALAQAQARDEIWTDQVQTMLKPIADRLLTQGMDLAALGEMLQRVLKTLQQDYAQTPGYGGGNVINLMRYLGMELSGLDASGLCLWQVNWVGADLRRANLAQADLSKSVFYDEMALPQAIALSPDGDLLAIGDAKGAIHLWHMDVGFTKRGVWRSHSEAIQALAFGTEGEALVSEQVDGTITLWDLETGQMRSLSGQGMPVCLQALEPNEGDRWLAGYADQIRALAFSPDGRWLVSAGDDYCVKIWERETGHCLKTIQGYSRSVRSLALHPNGYTLASASADGVLRLWDLSVQTAEDAESQPSSLESQRWRLDRPDPEVYAMTYSADGQMLIVAGRDRLVRVLDAQTGEVLKVLRGHSDWVWSVAAMPMYSASGSFKVASASGDRTIKLWDAGTGECLRTVRGHQQEVWSVAFHPRQPEMASSGADQTVRLWDVQTGECLLLLQGHTDAVRTVAFHPIGQLLASGSDDQTIRIWNLATGECLNILKGHLGTIFSLAFSPDGQWLASGSGDRTIKLWNIASLGSQPVNAQSVMTSEAHCTLASHGDRVPTVVFSPNGTWIVSGSADETIKRWSIQTGDCLETLVAELPYANLNIAGATGLSDGQKLALLQLGAVESDPMQG